MFTPVQKGNIPVVLSRPSFQRFMHRTYCRQKNSRNSFGQQWQSFAVGELRFSVKNDVSICHLAIHVMLQYKYQCFSSALYTICRRMSMRSSERLKQSTPSPFAVLGNSKSIIHSLCASGFVLRLSKRMKLGEIK